MRNGFLYLTVKFILDNLKHLTLVEWFKIIGYKILCSNPNDPKEQVKHRSNIVDLYNIIKWSIIILLFYFQWTNNLLTFLVWYLLLTNVYSYFYHHIWSEEAITTAILNTDRARRRFFLLMLSFSYSEFCFAYLYRLPYLNDFFWTGNASNSKSIWYSISNSFAANYEVVKPCTEISNSISMIQLLITFFFVTIIISKSIPEIRK